MKNSEIITKVRNVLDSASMKLTSTKLYADAVKSPIAKTQAWMQKKKEQVLNAPLPNVGPISLGPTMNMTVRDGIDAAKDSFSKIVTDKEGGGEETNGKVKDTGINKAYGIKSWDEITELLTKEGLDSKKISEILSIDKPNRPDPSTYLSKEYIDKHLSYFNDGVTKIKSKAPIDQEGIGLGTFVMPKEVADDVIKKANGDIRKLEELLGLNPGDLGENPIRLDVPNPKNIRVPSGNEAGAWDGYWTPGGYTKPGGVIEAVIDPVPKSEYVITEDILKIK